MALHPECTKLKALIIIIDSDMTQHPVSEEMCHATSRDKLKRDGGTDLSHIVRPDIQTLHLVWASPSCRSTGNDGVEVIMECL